MHSTIRNFLVHKLNSRVDRRRFLTGTAYSMALAACSPLTSVFAEGTEVGGDLIFFGWEGEHGENVAKAFFSSNEIRLKASFQSAADEALTRISTGGRGSIDILTPNKDFLRAILKSNFELFQPLDLDKIPNASGLFPAFKAATWLSKQGQTYGVPIIWGDEPCVFNPEKWDAMPPRYLDFADPKYLRELVLLDDPYGNIWLFATSLGIAEPSRLTARQLQSVLEAMLSIKPNVVTIGTSHGDMADVLIRGDASIGIGGWAYQVIIAREKGVELAIGTPEQDGTFFWSDCYAIAVDAPNSENAYAFINFMTSINANAELAIELGSGCTIEAAFDQLPPAEQALFPYETVRDASGGVLASQIVLPLQEPVGNIVGARDWVRAWQIFKAS